VNTISDIYNLTNI